MPYQNLKPAAAKRLLDEGWIYLDVRTPEEFHAGHATGAVNVPFALRDGMGRMQANPEFLRVVQALYPLETALVVGCASGVRSLHACDQLTSAGFAKLANVSSGFSGSRDPLGGSEPGWQAAGLPCETGTPADRSWKTLSQKA